MEIQLLTECLPCGLSWPHRTVAVLNDLMRDDRGVAMIEYALLSGLVALAALEALTLLGSAVASLYDTIATTFAAAMPPPPSP